MSSPPAPRMSKLLALVLGGPAVLAALLLLVASVLPLRFDLRTFQLQARLDELGLPRGADFLVLTTDNAIESAELSTFALAHWTFPRGARHWLTLSERSQGAWSGGFLGVDPDGRFVRPEVKSRGWAWVADRAPDWLPGIVEHGVLVFDSAATQRVFEERLPLLRAASQRFVLVSGERSRLPLSRPRLDLDLGTWWRLTAALGVLLAGAALGYSIAGISSGTRWVAACVGGVAASGAWAATVYVVGQFLPWAWTPVTLALWIGGTLAVARRDAPAISWPSGRAMLVTALVVVVYAAVTTLRLDFDGDTYTTYLQVARYYFWAGQHEPRDPGIASLVQGGVYPPGFAVLLSLPLWITDQPREASLALGPATSLAVLLYRWLIVALNLAVLAAVFAYLRALPGGSIGHGLGGIATLLLVLPLLRGQHIAAETVLVPWLAMALLGTLGGRRFDQPWLAAAGLFLGGLLSLVKLEGLLFVLLLVLPAALSVRTSWTWRREALVAVGLALGLAPYLVWRASGPVTNPAFGGLGLSHVTSQLAGLIVEAFKLSVKHELWIPLTVMLPAAVVWRWREGPRALLPVVGIITVSSAWICVYAFSTLGAFSHMQTSFPRIMLGPALAAALFALEAFCLASPPSGIGDASKA